MHIGSEIGQYGYHIYSDISFLNFRKGLLAFYVLKDKLPVKGSRQIREAIKGNFKEERSSSKGWVVSHHDVVDIDLSHAFPPKLAN